MQCSPCARRLPLADGDLILYERFYDGADGDRLFAELLERIDWRQEHLTMFGRRVPLPRLTAWYGDPGAVYRYSGLTQQPLPWLAPLLAIREHLRGTLGTDFNSVLLNLYRTGNDGMSWHSDDEPELGADPVIASLSLGATRRFMLRHRTRNDRLALDLPHGSLLLMTGATQRHWQHQVPKTRRPAGPRINLTFRMIVTGHLRADPAG